MKKRILIVIGHLNIGGAEKSCISFLNTLPSDRYEVDLMLLSFSGIFINEIPKWVNLIEAPLPLACLAHRPTEWKYYIKHNPIIWSKKVIRTWKAKRQIGLNIAQSIWNQWETDIPMFSKEYDVAIGFIQGICNYFIIEKVNAKRKIIWMHNDYDKINYSHIFDIDYFSQADVIATMSQIAQHKLQKRFPNLATRIRFIENIINPNTLKMLADAPVNNNLWKRFDGLKIISCGRLEPVKSYESAIRAASLIKKEGIPFKWILIGDGSERNKLEKMKRDCGVDEEFHLTGGLPNPYPYMKQADMLVVTSRYEGLPLVINEAKILGTPVVTTNYPTATEAVAHEETGLICDMTPESIAQAVIRLYRDNILKKHIRKTLSMQAFDNTKEIRKYIEAIEGM